MFYRTSRGTTRHNSLAANHLLEVNSQRVITGLLTRARRRGSAPRQSATARLTESDRRTARHGTEDQNRGAASGLSRERDADQVPGRSPGLPQEQGPTHAWRLDTP